MNFKEFYIKMMSDKLIVPMILIVWVLQYIISSRLGLYNIPFIVVLLLTYYVGVRTERVFGNSND